MLLELLLAGKLTTYQPTPDKLITVKPPLVISQEVKPVEAPELTELPELPTIPVAPPKPAVAPQNSPQSKPTPNDYEAGQCTWYVKQRKPNIPNGWHDATDWKYHATKAGWTVSKTPKPGAIGWVYGHVVYVESVQGNQVTISEMNYDYVAYHKRTVTVPSSKYTYLYEL